MNQQHSGSDNSDAILSEMLSDEVPVEARSAMLTQLRAFRERLQTDKRETGVASAPHYSVAWPKTLLRAGIAAVALTLVAVVGWLALSGEEAVAAPTWNDITRQTTGVIAAYLDASTYDGERLIRREEIWFTSAPAVRQMSYELIDGQAVPASGAIATPDAAVRWNEQTCLAENASTDNPYMVQARAAGMFQAVLGMSVLADQPLADIKINGQQVEFHPAGEAHPADATLRGYRLRTREPQAALYPLFETLVYWFDAKSNVLRRLSVVHGDERTDMVVQIDPELPDGWFDPVIPDGFHDVAAGIRARLSDDVREVYDQVAAARQRFGDYRAIIWRDNAGHGRWPTHRESASGLAWRCDMIDGVSAFAAAKSGDNPHRYVETSPDEPFATAWKEVNRSDYGLEITAMRWDDRYAIVHYKLSGRGPRVSAKLFDTLGPAGYEGPYFDPAIRFVSWPEWISWENLHPHGRNLREPALQWRLLPASPDRPETVTVEGRRDRGDLIYVRYTFDSSKDWLCIRQELRYANRDSDAMTVAETARTEDGFWYPKCVSTGISGHGSTYRYSVARGSPQPEFFDWPEGVPQPTDPFGALFGGRSGAKSEEADLPETAKGKFTAFESRGLPRGFDTRKESDDHGRMVRNMREIARSLCRYANRHGWNQPETLQELVDGGYLEAEQLANPLHPEADPPFVYIRPDKKLPNSQERMVLYEPFDKWPGVVTVTFQDESAEHIHSKAEFDKLLHEATAPAPPSRPYGD